jgi:G:T-mismatch repair DNA endonuclease (very short patch repair protein)
LRTRALRKLGWSVGVIWECQTRVPAKLAKRLEALLQLSSDGAKRKLRRQER